MRALTNAGVWVRPRYADAAHTHVSGYAVALAPAGGRMADEVWFGGGRLAADLKLPKLRRHGGLGHLGDPKLTPADALAEWARPMEVGSARAGLSARAQAARLRTTGAFSPPRPGAGPGAAAVRSARPPRRRGRGR